VWRKWAAIEKINPERGKILLLRPSILDDGTFSRDLNIKISFKMLIATRYTVFKFVTKSKLSIIIYYRFLAFVKRVNLIDGISMLRTTNYKPFSRWYR
jgi:hypothetical protein